MATPGQTIIPSPATAVIFNPDEAVARCFGSQDMLREMVRYFLDEVDHSCCRIRASQAQGDVKEVGRLGHELKGTLVYLGAQPAIDAVLRLEQCCKSSDCPRAGMGDAVDVLERECATLKSVLCMHPLAADPSRITPL